MLTLKDIIEIEEEAESNPIADVPKKLAREALLAYSGDWVRNVYDAEADKCYLVKCDKDDPRRIGIVIDIEKDNAKL